jgi:tetratricopeptide (TPR) repeat protein
VLNTAVDIGIPGAIALYTFFVAIVLRALRRVFGRSADTPPILYVGFLSAAIGYLAHLQLSLSVPSTAALFWIALGVLAAPFARVTSDSRSRVFRLGSAWIAIAGALLTGILLIQVYADGQYAVGLADRNAVVRVAAFERAVSTWPFAAAYRRQLAQQRAMGFANAAAELRQRSRSGEDITAERLMVQSRFAGVEQSVKETIDYTPYDPANYIFLVNLYNSAAYVFGEPDYYSRALDAAVRAADVAPRRPDILTAVAISYANLGDVDRAFPLLAQARDIDPLYPDAWIRTASILIEQGEVARALQVIEEARTYLPDNVTLETWSRELASAEPSSTP